MASLFERITGVNISDESHERIPISVIISLMRERYRGEVTADQIYVEFGFTAPQRTEFDFLYTKIADSINPERSLNIVKDWISLAEVSGRIEYRDGAMAEKYRTKSNFVTRLNNLG